MKRLLLIVALVLLVGVAHTQEPDPDPGPATYSNKIISPPSRGEYTCQIRLATEDKNGVYFIAKVKAVTKFKTLAACQSWQDGIEAALDPENQTVGNRNQIKHRGPEVTPAE